MKKRVMLVSAVLLVLTATAAIAAVTASASGAAKVNVRTTSLGKILVNAQGRTLYLFAPDKHGKSTCYGSCASYWPPLLATGKPAAGAGVKASLLGTTTRKDGKHQVTYNGHPLYLFVGDNTANATNGQAVTAFGAPWFAVSPAGNAVTKRCAATGCSSGY